MVLKELQPLLTSKVECQRHLGSVTTLQGGRNVVISWAGKTPSICGPSPIVRWHFSKRIEWVYDEQGCL